MHGLRWIFSVGTGAVIGVAAAIALDLSFRLLHRPAPARADTHDANAPVKASHRFDPQGWPVKATIVAVAVAAYTLIGYDYRPVAPATPPEPATADASTSDSGSGAAPDAGLDSGPVAFTLGGTTLSFAPPAGSCLYPAPLLEAIKLQQAKLNPDNVIDTAFADCKQLRDTVANQVRTRDFGILMTPKADLNRPIDRAAIETMTAGAPGPTPDSDNVKATLDQRLSAAQSKLALQSFSALGIVDRDSQAVYFAYLSRAQGAEGEYMQACVMAMAAINGRMVSYYLYSDYAKDPRSAIFSLLQKVKNGVADFAQRNRS
jgi:hypothetical protein